MKKLVFSVLFAFMLLISLVFAGNGNTSSWNAKPLNLLDNLKSDSDVQNTALDKVGSSGKGIEDTLFDIKTTGLGGYIQWMGFIGLSLAFLLIIYNGIIILANFGGENKLAKAKKRFISLTIGVVIVTSGYLIIKLVVSLLGNIF